MFDLLVGAGLALMVQPSVSDTPNIACQEQAVIQNDNVDAPLCGYFIILDGELEYDEGGSADYYYALGPAPRAAGPDGSSEETFWVVSQGASYLIGTTSDGITRATMHHLSVWPNEGTHSTYEWTREDIACGESGPRHIFGFSGNSRYAVAGYSTAGEYAFCRFDFRTMTQSVTWVPEGEEYFRLDQLDVSVGDDGLMIVRTPGGEELLRNRPEPPEVDCTTFGAAVTPLWDVTSLCGITMGGGYVAMDGLPIAPALPLPGMDLRGRPDFWVVREGDHALIGIRSERSNTFDSMMMISLDAPRSFAPVYCGPNHVVTVSRFQGRQPRYLDVIGQGWEDTRLLCRLDFQEWNVTAEIEQFGN